MNTYTNEDWKRDKIFNAQIGQPIDEKVVNEMVNSVPPVTYGHNLIQTGDPYDASATLPHANLYTTFRKENGQWIYVGNCRLGSDKNEEGFYEAVLKRKSF